MAKETEGGTWINVNSNEQKGHVNIYGSDSREPMMNQYILISITIKEHFQLMKNRMVKKLRQIVNVF